MKRWIRFFVGTPRSFLMTIAVISAAVVLAKPDLLTQAVNGLLAAIKPLMEPVLTVAIAAAAIRFMLFGSKKSKK